MKQDFIPSKKWLVTPRTSMPLWNQWAYLARPVIIVAFRVQSRVRLPFSPGGMGE